MKPNSKNPKCTVLEDKKPAQLSLLPMSSIQKRFVPRISTQTHKTANYKTNDTQN